MNIVTRKTDDLAIHPVVKSLPMLAVDHPKFISLLDSIEDEGGVPQALIVDEHDQVMDGRHRLMAAKIKRIAEVPCIVKPADQCATIVLRTLLARRHYNKGALAYMTLPMLDAAIAESATRRLAALKKGKSPSTASGGSREKSPSTASGGPREKTPMEAFAERLGVSTDELGKARKVAKLFAAQDTVIAGWLERSPEAAAAWDKWDQEQPRAWGTFSQAWNRQAGLDPAVDGGSDALPPENFRERWEPDLFEGEIGLGGIIQAIAGLVSTKGKTRGDKEDGEDAAYLAALRRIERFNTEAFARWSDLPPERRVPLIQQFTGSLPEWPDDVRRAVHAQLKEIYGSK